MTLFRTCTRPLTLAASAVNRSRRCGRDRVGRPLAVALLALGMGAMLGAGVLSGTSSARGGVAHGPGAEEILAALRPLLDTAGEIRVAPLGAASGTGRSGGDAAE
ncbi:hypothetical protein [Celeribacter indicus]|uniref:Uncharacterized protein n=1 Tax=Celeribacter indicus TaxID=1208324 RepID=A0A0B5DZF6_9RHOB|nr:hypothetical protein [Celeribacter indicus]AJE48399.1 hypothetical protein P73_3684 [Celeribacter indicus]SDX58390.1 hypothetical protein SAMN05443573_1468 [Celeribacter indicus]